jgi:glutamate synthase (NADPH/NADH) small chain
VAYRRSKKEMGAYEFEYDLAKGVGVTGLFNVSPIEILGNGKVEGIKFIRTISKGDEIEVVPNSEFIEECDVVIRATGQSKMVNLYSLIEGLQVDELKRIKVNKENYQTTNPNYFAGGDAVNGGVEVVNAVAEAKIAAQGINKYLTNK